MSRRKSPSHKPFDKYHYYLESVQDPAHSADFIENAFYRQYRSWPKVLREDFCGAFALCCEWVTRGEKYRATAVDLDWEPLRYGKENYWKAIPKSAQERLKIVRGDVLKSKLPKAQVIAALNFSFFFIKERKLLVEYFKRCRKSLTPKGMLVLDCFGGPETHSANEDVSKLRGFTYYWDQVCFDPITHRGLFHIHFKRPGEKKRLGVFTYDWRMWGIAEIRDALEDAGFRKSVVYWEGTNSDGTGNSRFSPLKVAHEECDAWVVYIVAFP